MEQNSEEMDGLLEENYYELTRILNHMILVGQTAQIFPKGVDYKHYLETTELQWKPNLWLSGLPQVDSADISFDQRIDCGLGLGLTVEALFDPNPQRGVIA